MADDVYEPREDSLLLEKYVRKLSKGLVLDMGAGSGIQTKAAAGKAVLVVCVDINQRALDFCKENIKLDNVKFLRSDLFSAFKKQPMKFDMIIFNAPYLPDDENVRDLALDGGKEGYEVIERFLKGAKHFLAKDGMILLVFSSLTGREKVNMLIWENGFKFQQLEKIHISFEDIYCYKISPR